EGDGQGIKIDGAEQALGLDLLIEKNGEQEADYRRQADEADGEDDEIGDAGVPAAVRPQRDVLLKADKTEGRESLGVGEGEDGRPRDEAVDEDKDDDDGRNDEEDVDPSRGPAR